MSRVEPVTRQDRVGLRVPADPAYLTVLRTATAGLAARLDLTLDEIEDLRIAVDEACVLLLVGAADGDHLDASFQLEEDLLDIAVTGPASSLPNGHSLTWAVLAALVGDVTSGSRDGISWIRLRHRRAGLET
ncbi:MAG: anti-sigma regulatory factor [Actinomycetes bacterium]